MLTLDLLGMMIAKSGVGDSVVLEPIDMSHASCTKLGADVCMPANTTLENVL